jgi:flavin reductase (DIM6/NTAB) family NADH-FMN oxidoreductase RutF
MLASPASGVDVKKPTASSNGRAAGALVVEVPGVDKATFFAIMGAFPTGVTIVTTLGSDGKPRGLTSNAVCSVSAEPPLLLVCVDKRSNTLPSLLDSRRFVVNYLSAGRGDVSNLFASKEADKFAGIAWRFASNGMPWLHQDSLAYAECVTEREIDAGDHVVIVGRVVGGEAPVPGSEPLLYFRRTYGAWAPA